jgi:hypothetical protein
MADRSAMREPMLAPEGGRKSREGIVVSTVLRLTTTDGERFEDISKAMEHEAFYQILKHLVKEQGWSDNEETATFAMRLARNYASLLPVLSQIEADAAALREHLKAYQHAEAERELY